MAGFRTIVCSVLCVGALFATTACGGAEPVGQEEPPPLDDGHGSEDPPAEASDDTLAIAGEADELCEFASPRIEQRNTLAMPVDAEEASSMWSSIVTEFNESDHSSEMEAVLDATTAAGASDGWAALTAGLAEHGVNDYECDALMRLLGGYGPH